MVLMALMSVGSSKSKSPAGLRAVSHASILICGGNIGLSKRLFNKRLFKGLGLHIC